MKKVLAILLAFILMFALIAGCTDNSSPSSTPTPSQGTSTPDGTATPSGEGEAAGGFVNEPNTYTNYPLTDETVSFEMWTRNGTTFEDFADYNDNEFYKNMEKVTGVHMDFIHPVVGSENENFQLIIVGGDYPDVFHGIYNYHVRGMDKAIEEDIIIRLNEYVETVMPNYNYQINRLPEIRQQSLTDTGNLWAVHHLVDRPQGAFIGLGIRQDWLDDAGLQKPSTISELENVLTVFKDNYTRDGSGPLWLAGSGFSYGSSINGSYNVAGTKTNKGFINKNGVATFSPLEPGYYDYIVQMSDWYEKGLIYRDFAGTDILPKEPQVTTNQVGVHDFVYTYASMYKKAAEDANYRLVGLTTPKLNAGDNLKTDIHVRQQQQYIRAGNSGAISSQCSDPELLCKYFDYPYSEEGIILGNYGIQGETFEYNAEGEPEYMPWLMEKYGNISYVQTKFVVHNGPTYSIWSRECSILTDDEYDCMEIWDAAGSDWIMPEITLTSEEGTEFSGIINDINTFVEENAVQFIMGQKSLDTFDAFIAQIKGMNVDRAIEIQQDALDRYIARLEL